MVGLLYDKTCAHSQVGGLHQHVEDAGRHDVLLHRGQLQVSDNIHVSSEQQRGRCRRSFMSLHHSLICHYAMPRLNPDRYSYSEKRIVYQLDGVLLNFCARRTRQSVVTPVLMGTWAACSTKSFHNNFDM